MYQTLLFFHSLCRWLVLVTLLYAISRAYTGIKTKRNFDKTDNAVRHWTATVGHIQLVLGLLLYFKSPVISYFFKNTKEGLHHTETTFFSVIHSSLMMFAIVILTIGSALAKRRNTDREKFKTMLFWFSLTLIIILISIPWPFSPLAARPYFR